MRLTSACIYWATIRINSHVLNTSSARVVESLLDEVLNSEEDHASDIVTVAQSLAEACANVWINSRMIATATFERIPEHCITPNWLNAQVVSHWSAGTGPLGKISFVFFTSQYMSDKKKTSVGHVPSRYPTSLSGMR